MDPELSIAVDFSLLELSLVTSLSLGILNAHPQSFLHLLNPDDVNHLTLPSPQFLSGLMTHQFSSIYVFTM